MVKTAFTGRNNHNDSFANAIALAKGRLAFPCEYGYEPDGSICSRAMFSDTPPVYSFSAIRLSSLHLVCGIYATHTETPSPERTSVYLPLEEFRKNSFKDTYRPDIRLSCLSIIFTHKFIISRQPPRVDSFIHTGGFTGYFTLVAQDPASWPISRRYTAHSPVVDLFAA
ncbi:hypothetical protein M422DRAFT_275902 [Sphaerobolus stellatus SS14]|uniref:Uncharacterized protein n=1 Tax=Sphaerobolus stellatus (strain SS14) TaxID=990650 RepID=A0A0C9TNP5_SPHS4|nr:hypothetical protein M422DRAFT_275902 [Sphaerobolus stellatus SS14]